MGAKMEYKKGRDKDHMDIHLSKYIERSSLDRLVPFVRG